MNRIEIERERLLGRLLGGLAIAASVAYLPSVYFAFVEGLYALVAVDTLAYAFVVAAAFLRRLGFVPKLGTIVFACLVLGAAVLFNTGAQGAGYIWLIGGIVLSALFGRSQIAVAAFAVSFLLMVAYGVALAFGLDGRGLTLKTLVIIGSNLFVVCITLVLIIHRILRSLETALDEGGFLADNLAAELAESERTRRELAKASEEKGVLIQELHHRVNNNMQLMLSLLELEREDLGACSKIRRRIKVLSAANEVVLWEESATGARLADIVGAAVDATAELEDRKEWAERKRKRISHQDGAAANRFLDSRTAVIFALCLSDLLEAETEGCGIVELEISGMETASRVAAVFDAKSDPALVEQTARRLELSVLAEAAADCLSYAYLPPAYPKGASIAVDIRTEPRCS